MDSALHQKIANLPDLSKTQLLPIWSENFSTPPPPKLRKELMVPILAYRLQEKEYGGLSHSARKRLKYIALSLGAHRRSSSPKPSDPDSGSRLIRVWGGEVHEVDCRDGLYVYRGKQFTSLSRIAREITGTHWSGPAFFGTKRKEKK